MKSHFWYNNSQRNGVLFLAILIVVLQLIYFFVVPKVIDIFNKDSYEFSSTEIVHYQKKIDSLKQLKLATDKPNIYPFNPSFLTDFKGYQLGMSVEEIDRLLKHRANGKYINSVSEFKSITKVSDSLLAIISPYFNFPDWIANKKEQHLFHQDTFNKNTDTFSMVEDPIGSEIKDLNTATEKDLQSIRGIGKKLSERIINYRTKLGGFLLNDQLYEVYYLDSAIADNILQQFQISEVPLIEKIDVNTATFKQVLSIVYIDFELTKKIFEYRDEVAEIQSLEELKKIEDFPLDKFDRIALYLDAK